MRILIASPYLPWPLNAGGNAAQFSTLQCLAADHEFTLVCPIFSAEEKVHASELSQRLPKVRVRAVYCGEPVAAWWAVRTVRRALRFFQRAIGPGASPPGLGYPFAPLPPAFIEVLGEELNRGTDLCQAEFAPMLPLGAWFPKSIPRLFVHHQIHFVYAERFLEVHGDCHFGSYLREVMRVQELSCLKHFDSVITFSEEDRCALLPHLPADSVFTSPFPIPADVGIASQIHREFDGRFLFVASEVNGPNIDALEWLLEKIWPQILLQLPAARLVVVGRWSHSSRSRFSVPGVSFAGFVSDLPSTLRGGIMLVPVRIGSGIRAKILVALAQGMPVVSTSVGVEGLLVRDEEELLVRDAAAEFAAAAVRLARNDSDRHRLAIAGLASVSKHYSAEVVRRRRNDIYESIVAARRIETSAEPRFV